MYYVQLEETRKCIQFPNSEYALSIRTLSMNSSTNT